MTISGKLLDLMRAAPGSGRSTGALEPGTGLEMVRSLALIAALASVLLVSGCQQPYSGTEPPPDEAMVRAISEGKTPEKAAYDYFYPQVIEDYFPKMDSLGLGSKDWPDQLIDKKAAPKAAGTAKPSRGAEPVALTQQEALGRNTWMIWCAGNEGFWDWLSNNSYGASDILKVIDSRNRGTLFRDAGLINEPEMSAPGTPEPSDFGVWLSVPSDPKLRASRATYLNKAFGLLESGGRLYPGSYPTPAPAGKSATPASGGAATDPYASGYPPPEIYGLSSGVIRPRVALKSYGSATSEIEEAWSMDLLHV
ncbi:MAG: hypothetical protein ACLQGP_14840 [Isosphaeraceae bacterium]